MKNLVIAFITIVILSSIVSCKKTNDSVPAGKMKIIVRPVGIDNNTSLRSESSIMWVTIKK